MRLYRNCPEGKRQLLRAHRKFEFCRVRIKICHKLCTEYNTRGGCVVTDVWNKNCLKPWDIKFSYYHPQFNSNPLGTLSRLKFARYRLRRSLRCSKRWFEVYFHGLKYYTDNWVYRAQQPFYCSQNVMKLISRFLSLYRQLSQMPRLEKQANNFNTSLRTDTSKHFMFA